jgi:Transglutaminase-like superfamily
MKIYLKRALLSLLIVVTSGTLLLHPSLPWSTRCRHILNRLVVKGEIRLARWRGQAPKLASIEGKLPIRGAEVEALDSASGWAGLSGADGRFVLPDVMWYPGANYDFLVSADAYNVRYLKLVAPAQYPDGGTIDVGDLDPEKGCEIDIANLPGVNSVSYRDYDFANIKRYKALFDSLTAGKKSDDDILDAINKYVASRLDYHQSAEGCEDASVVLDRGSRYCGDLTLLMATIAEAGSYKTRIIDLSDGTDNPNTHVVVEVYYGDGWRLYDPTYGICFRNKDGRVTNYKQLRLNTDWINEQTLRRFDPLTRNRLLGWMPAVYGSGYHHVYKFKKRTAQCALWMPTFGAMPSPSLTRPRKDPALLLAAFPGPEPLTNAKYDGPSDRSARKPHRCKLCDLEASYHSVSRE